MSEKKKFGHTDYRNGKGMFFSNGEIIKRMHREIEDSRDEKSVKKRREEYKKNPGAEPSEKAKKLMRRGKKVAVA